MPKLINLVGVLGGIQVKELVVEYNELCNNLTIEQTKCIVLFPETDINLNLFDNNKLSLDILDRLKPMKNDNEAEVDLAKALLLRAFISVKTLFDIPKDEEQATIKIFNHMLQVLELGGKLGDRIFSKFFTRNKLFTPLQVKALFNFLRCYNINKLDLSGSYLTQECILLISKEITLYNTLTAIILENCNLNDDAISHLFEAFSEIDSLKYISLNHNNIGFKGASIIAKYKTYEMLDIEYNKINDDGALLLADKYKNEFLALGHNPINALTANAIDAINLMGEGYGGITLDGAPTLSPEFFSSLQKNGITSIGIFSAQNKNRSSEVFKELNNAYIEGANRIYGGLQSGT